MAQIVAPSASTFGLPASLRVPIAATDPKAVETYVGQTLRAMRNARGDVVALLVQTRRPLLPKEASVPLWQHPQKAIFEQRLFPDLQVWVHVEYADYRSAYITLGMPNPGACFLDHVQNREAIRLRGNSHPYLRLCPVSRGVNTSGGHAAGGEGMEKDFLRQSNANAAGKQELQARLSACPIVYADPMDLTKMLNIAPGTGILEGVRTTQALFFPR